MDTPYSKTLTERLMHLLNPRLLLTRPFLIGVACLAGICVILGIVFGFVYGSNAYAVVHHVTDPLLHTLFRVAKIMMIIADIIVFYTVATFAWASYRSPESPTLQEAAQKVRSLAIMIGGLLGMIVTQLLFFSRV